MLSEISYGTFANYSPRGRSELSQRSRNICGGIKAGSIDLIESAIPHLRSPAAEPLGAFLNPNATLVPVPRSAPLAAGALWPARVIANVLLSAGFGSDVLPCIVRRTAVRKSSSSPASERPLVPEHYDSLGMDAGLATPVRITLVDDG